MSKTTNSWKYRSVVRKDFRDGAVDVEDFTDELRYRKAKPTTHDCTEWKRIVTGGYRFGDRETIYLVDACVKCGKHKGFYFRHRYY